MPRNNMEHKWCHDETLTTKNLPAIENKKACYQSQHFKIFRPYY